MKRTTYQTGLLAETLCRAVLRIKLYRILAQRYKTPFGEIDIIAAKGNTLVAIEVKARNTADQAAHAISQNQQRRITNAFRYYIGKNPERAQRALRFDVMLVSRRAWPIHLQNAWTSDLAD